MVYPPIVVYSSGSVSINFEVRWPSQRR